MLKVIIDFDGTLTVEEKQAALNVHASLGLVSSDSPQLEAALKPTLNWFAK